MCDNTEVTQVLTQDRNVGLSWTSSHSQAIGDPDVPPALAESSHHSTPWLPTVPLIKNKPFREVYSCCAEPQS